VNLKELEALKELVDDTLECITRCDESLAEEMAFQDGPAGPAVDGDDAQSGEQGLGDEDSPEDPLAESRGLMTRAFANLAEVLDITEPHRKRYREAAGKSSRAGGLAQKAIREVVATERRETLSNGKGTKQAPNRVARRRIPGT